MGQYATLSMTWAVVKCPEEPGIAAPARMRQMPHEDGLTPTDDASTLARPERPNLARSALEVRVLSLPDTSDVASAA